MASLEFAASNICTDFKYAKCLKHSKSFDDRTIRITGIYCDYYALDIVLSTLYSLCLLLLPTSIV